MVTKRRPFVWRAASDQIAHAHEPQRSTVKRTLCGLRVVDQRMSWPPLVKCPDCLAVSGVKVVAL